MADEKKLGSVPAGGKDPAREHAQANKDPEPQPAAAAGGKDAAREYAIKHGEQT